MNRTFQRMGGIDRAGKDVSGHRSRHKRGRIQLQQRPKKKEVVPYSRGGPPQEPGVLSCEM